MHLCVTEWVGPRGCTGMDEKGVYGWRGCKTWRDKNVTREKEKELIRTWWRAREGHFRAPLLLQGPRASWRPRVCSHACVQMALTSHPFQGGWGKWSVYSNGRRAHLSCSSAGPSGSFAHACAEPLFAGIISGGQPKRAPIQTAFNWTEFSVSCV